MSVRSTALLALVLVLPGCSRCGDDEAVREEPGAPGLPRLHARPLGSVRAMTGFRQRMDSEAKNRKPVPLPAEAVLATLETDGVVLDRKRQQMATPHSASYCMSAHAGKKVHLTVCEHESDERAEEHVKATQKLERPERRIGKNGTTTLLVRRDLNDDSEAPLVDKILRAFEQQKPADGG